MNFKIIHIDETDSTNRWLRSFCSKENRREGETLRGSVETTPKLHNSLDKKNSLVVVAEYQTAGKGCGTNTWESERGKNLTFSMLIHPEEIPANQQFHITEIVSVALCETLEQMFRPLSPSDSSLNLGEQKVTIKWPNDIYVGERKICGILIENRLQGATIKESIIGIGLNVNQQVFVSDAPNPVSLYQLIGRETALDEILNRFLVAFNEAYHSKTTCFDYREMLFRKGKDALYKDETTCFTARLTDVLPDGRLLLVDNDGQERLYAFKEVQFII